jgi:ferredoxin-NADP reductase
MVEPPELAFEAGQWIAIPLDEKTVRPYSMASPPSERRVIRLCVDVKPGGSGSRYFRELRMGDEVRFQPPLGTLTLIRDSTAPVLMIAEEIGVVPFRSILLAQAELGVPRPMTLPSPRRRRRTCSTIPSCGPCHPVTRGSATGRSCRRRIPPGPARWVDSLIGAIEWRT